MFFIDVEVGVGGAEFALTSSLLAVAKIARIALRQVIRTTSTDRNRFNLRLHELRNWQQIEFGVAPDKRV